MTQSDNTASRRLKSNGGREKESTLGVPVDGAVDPTGEYPRRYNWFGSSISQAGRGVKINSLKMQGAGIGVNFDVSAPSPSMYPYNYAMETPSGHSFEIDDTPGHERILLKHHTGGGIEIQPDGSVVIVSNGKGVHVTNGEYGLAVSGEGNMTFSGDLNLDIGGNFNVKCAGYNLEVGNNFNQQVNGTLITETGDVHQTIVRGNKDVKVYGDTLDFHVGERKIVTKKDLRIIPKRDFIVNSKRHIRFTAEEFLTASTGKLVSLSSERMNIQGRKGKIGGDNFHYLGSLFTGPSGDKGDPRNDMGQKTVFHGNLIGRALEAWTAKYSLYADEAHSSWRAANAVNSDATALAAIAANPRTSASSVVMTPDYKFKWGWNVEDNTAYEQPLNVLENYDCDGEGGKSAIDPIPIAPFYTTNEDWFEVWNKTSPFAVRKVYVDEDDYIQKKLGKIDVYSGYFKHSPDTAEVRAKLRTMDQANDPATCPEMQTDHDKAEAALLEQNRLSPKYKAGYPPSPYKVKRKGKDFKDKYGYTLLGNPPERASKTFTPNNKPQTRQLLIDPKYNPYRQESPITNKTKLSKTMTMASFLGAPGSKSTLESVPIDEDRMDLARYWVCHAQIIEGVNNSPYFKGHRLVVTEGYYQPNSGIREHYKPGEPPEKRYWREPYRNEDGGILNRTLSGHPTNQRKHEGMMVYATLFNTRGKIDYSATFECACYIRDTFFFRELCLDYDITRPDDVMTAQIGIYMPVIPSDEFRGNFEQKLWTSFNRVRLDETDLLEITDL